MKQIKRWYWLAGLSLLFSGILAFLLSIARMPIFMSLISDPVFFRKALVAHVNLGLLVWIFSFMVAVFYWFNYNEKDLYNDKNIELSWIFSFVGVLIIGFSWFFLKDSYPVLSNYVPMIGHFFYFYGIVLFLSGILGALLNFPKLFSFSKNHFPVESKYWIKVSVLIFIVAIETLIFSYFTTSRELETLSYYEILYWGFGHLITFSAEALKISLWFYIFYFVIEKNRISVRIKSKYFVYLSLLFLLPPSGSLIVNQFNPASSEYRNFFTELMKWGIFPFTTPIMVYLFYKIIEIFRKYNLNRQDLLLLQGLIFSFILTILGFVLGFSIRKPNTMIPAHYHASVGSITLTLMIASPLLIRFIGLPFEDFIKKIKFYSYQPVIYGAGQSIFAMGFAFAGINGMGRKLYGNEQQIRGFFDYLGLSLVGIGGSIAVLAGILYIIMFLYCFTKRRRIHSVRYEKNYEIVDDIKKQAFF